MLLNSENFTSHCLKNPEIWLVLLIGPLLIRTYCVYINRFLCDFFYFLYFLPSIIWLNLLKHLYFRPLHWPIDIRVYLNFFFECAHLCIFLSIFDVFWPNLLKYFKLFFSGTLANMNFRTWTVIIGGHYRDIISICRQLAVKSSQAQPFF